MDDRLHTWWLNRRRLLATGVAGIKGAALASLPLVGCGDGDSPRRPGAQTPDTGGSGDTTPDMDSGLPPDDAGDAGIDVGHDSGTDAVDPGTSRFRMAVIADSHIIDEYYSGQESNELDTSSLYEAADRLASVVHRLNTMEPRPAFVVHVGDVVHDYPSTDRDFLFRERTRHDIAGELLGQLQMPWYGAFGNHDYDIGVLPRALTEELFAAKLGMQPYVHVDHNGWRFVVLNNFLGATCDPTAPNYNRGRGSFGREQLEWFEGLLQDGLPTFVFLHYTLGLCDATEFGDLGLHTLLERYKDTIRYVLAGHTHRWLPLGNTYGPEHMILGATRYDEDNYMVIDVDPAVGGFTFANADAWGNYSLYADPWEPGAR